jgi:hypothetical protein
METFGRFLNRGFLLAGAGLIALLTPGLVQAAGPYSFYPITPCRVVDTRSGLGGYTGKINNGQVVSFTIRGASPCNLPGTAQAVAFNVTVADAAQSGWVALYPVGTSWPGVSTINFISGENLANGAIVPLGSGVPDLNVLAAFEAGAQGVNLILDITGYFK